MELGSSAGSQPILAVSDILLSCSQHIGLHCAWRAGQIRGLGDGGLDACLSRQHIPVMNDPFVKPEEPTAVAAIEAIGEELALFDDWMERYEFIIGMGRKLPPFPDDWANDGHRVPGCQSRVWMEAILRDGSLYFAGKSDAAIVSGLVALLLRVYSGRPPEEILGTDPIFLKDLGLLEALSTNRGNGIAAMARKVREVATIQQPA
jgi:cysteine desulfuration protein SufE